MKEFKILHQKIGHFSKNQGKAEKINRNNYRTFSTALKAVK